MTECLGTRSWGRTRGERKGGPGDDRALFIGDVVGVGRGGGASATVGARLAPKQWRAGADWWATAIVPGGRGLNTFQIQTTLKPCKL
jgi:hypothetical protein